MKVSILELGLKAMLEERCEDLLDSLDFAHWSPLAGLTGNVWKFCLPTLTMGLALIISSEQAENRLL